MTHFEDAEEEEFTPMALMFGVACDAVWRRWEEGVPAGHIVSVAFLLEGAHVKISVSAATSEHPAEATPQVPTNTSQH